MGMTKLSPQRLTEIAKGNIGKVIIFCEGMSEKLYLKYFADIIKKNKYTDIHIEIESANGNSKTVFNFAENFLNKEENMRKYVHHSKFLMFDCDDPPNIQEVIQEMQASDKEYSLLISNYLFEIWLLMHFEIVDKKLTKKETYINLGNYLTNGYDRDDKARAGIIREIIQNGSVEDAIKNAYILVRKYEAEGKSIGSNILEMNPYTNIHVLVEQFMAEIS